MVESTKKTTNNKQPAAESSVAEETNKPVEATNSEPKTNHSTQTIIIAVLVTILVCFVLIFGILLATGVIKFGDTSHNYDHRDTTSQNGQSNNQKSSPRKDGKNSGLN